MSDHKFFIGLGTTIPSTRILKPPGGDCSDLFGLKTRQKEQIRPLKGTSYVIDCLLRKEQPDVSHLKKPSRKSASLPVVASYNMNHVMSSMELPSPNGSVKRSNAVPSPDDSVASLLGCTESKSAKELTGFDINSVGDNFSGLNIKDQSSTSGMSARESLKSSSENSELSHLDKAKCGNIGQRETSTMSLNSRAYTKNGRLINNSSATADNHMDQKPEKQFIRNPITGALTEYKNWNKYDPVTSRMMSMQEVKKKTCSSEMSKNNTRITSDEALNPRRNVVSVKRNPITGDGIPINPHLSAHSRIRVIHPPGGSSSGIY